jgi:hypothetical protein
MIRPASEIEYPASEALRNRASMLARMETLNRSSRALMAVIAERIGAETGDEPARADALAERQEELIDNMRRLIRE